MVANCAVISMTNEVQREVKGTENLKGNQNSGDARHMSRRPEAKIPLHAFRHSFRARASRPFLLSQSPLAPDAGHDADWTECHLAYIDKYIRQVIPLLPYRERVAYPAARIQTALPLLTDLTTTRLAVQHSRFSDDVTLHFIRTDDLCQSLNYSPLSIIRSSDTCARAKTTTRDS